MYFIVIEHMNSYGFYLIFCRVVNRWKLGQKELLMPWRMQWKSKEQWLILVDLVFLDIATSILDLYISSISFHTKCNEDKVSNSNYINYHISPCLWVIWIFYKKKRDNFHLVLFCMVLKKVNIEIVKKVLVIMKTKNLKKRNTINSISNLKTIASKQR